MNTKIIENTIENNKISKMKNDLITKSYERYKNIFNSGHIKFKKLDYWLDKESSIFENEIIEKDCSFPKFKRGEIIKVDFGINIGTELSNTHFAIVLNSDDSNYNDNITVMPITSKFGYKRIPLGNLLKKAIPKTKRYNRECYGMLTQIKTISKKRVFETNFRYVCTSEILNKIDREIIKYLTKS